MLFAQILPGFLLNRLQQLRKFNCGYGLQDQAVDLEGYIDNAGVVIIDFGRICWVNW